MRLQSLLDIQDETRDATEFWDHVKVDLFPDAVYVFTPKRRIMAHAARCHRGRLRLRRPQRRG
jgi:(p)ppGpp synthase/HD superfamily hydrolase